MTKNLLDLSGKDLDIEIERISKANPPKRRFWTEKEMDIVRKMKERGIPNKTIAEQLGRTMNSVGYLVSRSPYY